MSPEEAEEMDAMDERIVSLQCRLDRARKERDAARTLIAELVTALEGLFVEYDYLCSEGSKYALRLGRVPDHACAECMPDGGPMVEPGFRCREHTARAALAKAKGTK